MEKNWVRLKLDYEHFLVMPAEQAPTLMQLLLTAKVIKEKYSATSEAIAESVVPGFDFVDNEYVMGAIARQKMLVEK